MEEAQLLCQDPVRPSQTQKILIIGMKYKHRLNSSWSKTMYAKKHIKIGTLALWRVVLVMSDLIAPLRHPKGSS